MPAKALWYVKYFDDMDMYEISFKTPNAYIMVEMYDYDEDNIEFSDEFGGTIIDNNAQTKIHLSEYGGTKGITIRSDSRGGGVSDSYIPLPDDMYRDIVKYIENGVMEDHEYESMTSNVAVQPTPSNLQNHMPTDPENPMFSNTNNPAGGTRRSNRRAKTMRKHKRKSSKKRQ
jgi:hypothetical protein